MKIKQTILQNILKNMPEMPPEIGGIFGGNNDIVTHYLLDKNSSAVGCYYTPNTTLLNHCIQEWQTEGISFLGIFHTHFFSVDTLSEGDKQYIVKIMQAMPPQISKLYFPIIVIPEKIMIPYVAMKKDDSIIIQKDDLFSI